MLKMGGLGGVYSAGKADPSEPIVEEGVTQDISFGDAVKERGKEGVFGAGVSAVIGGVFKGAFSARELAKELLKKGINPSPLQMIGIQTKGMEEAIAKIPAIGAGFKNAIKDFLPIF